MHLGYGGIKAHRHFQEVHNRLKNIIDAHKDGIEPLQEINLSEYGEADRRYLQFCVDNKLFLNAWAGAPDVARP